MTHWRRNTFTTFTLAAGFNWEHAIAAGDTYMRVHLRWGFYLDCPPTLDLAFIASNICSFGLVTTIGNGTETRPNARTGAADAAPPTQRWIYWETRAPVITAADEGSGIVAWRDSGTGEPSETKGQVLATGIPAGDTLNLSSVWAFAQGFDSSVNGVVWVSTSILTKS
jgi:hypothetical protein